MKSKYVASLTLIDPDTKLPVELEIRKLEDGAMIGIDGAWLEHADGETLSNPYDVRTEIEIPDNEDPGRVEIGVPLRRIMLVPYTNAEAREQAAANKNKVSGVISLPLNEFIRCGMDALLDAMEDKLVGDLVLSDITYDLVAHNGNELYLLVTGDLEDFAEA